MAGNGFPLNSRLSRLLHWRSAWRWAVSASRAALCAALLLAAGAASGQITINTQTGVVTNNSTGQVLASTVDRRYAQVQPTHVPLGDQRLDDRTRLLLIRELEAEHGFAMRPLPLGHTGLTLEANGGLSPAGENYLEMVTENGISSKPGDAVVITDVKIEGNRIVFMLNGGPDLKHRFLRHIEIGGMAGPDDGNDGGVPLAVPDQAGAGRGQEGTGSRVTLTFKHQVPAITSQDVKALLSPLISFGVKSPVEAYSDTLPAPLKQAVLAHRVLVGMTTDMVFYAKGQPDQKVREVEGQMPYEEWIYGKPPAEVDFVRINGNRVIRVEIARPGEALVVYTKDEVSGLMEVSALQPDAAHVQQLGDVQRDPNKQAPATPPTLRKSPDEPLAEGSPATQRQTAEKPVRFPKQDDQDQPWNNPDGVPSQSKPTGAQPAASGQTNGQPAAPATGTAPPPSAGQSQPAAPTSQQN